MSAPPVTRSDRRCEIHQIYIQKLELGPLRYDNCCRLVSMKNVHIADTINLVGGNGYLAGDASLPCAHGAAPTLSSVQCKYSAINHRLL